MQYTRLERSGNVATITIDRPDALNALNDAVLDDLAAALDALEQKDRCLIITGSGSKSFVAGADIAVMRSQNKAEAMAFGKKGSDLFRRIEALPMPVIAAVNGYALGGGFELAMACDIRIASESAVFALPEVTLGIIPGFGGTQRIAKVIGAGLAKEMLFSGRRMKAEEAKACALVNAVYPSETLMEEAANLAGRIAANAPIAVRAAKTAVNLRMDADMDADLDAAMRLYVSCYETADQKNAMTAFVEKRKPEPFEDR
ncbi:MAG: enoyl-CoA hydratase [Clostridiales bacterium]|nr:enoyl-CoA hydratase [Clostridiales bacterium]